MTSMRSARQRCKQAACHDHGIVTPSISALTAASALSRSPIALYVSTDAILTSRSTIALGACGRLVPERLQRLERVAFAQSHRHPVEPLAAFDELLPRVDRRRKEAAVTREVAIVQRLPGALRFV